MTSPSFAQRLRKVTAVVAATALVLTSAILIGSSQAAADPLLSGEVAITGTPAAGRTITANPTGWEPNTTFTFEWSRSGQEYGTTRNVRIRDDDQADTVYRVTVTAHKDGFDDGQAQASVTVQTSQPGMPTDLTAATSGRTVQLSWTAPVNTGGMPLYTYRVQYRPSSGGSWQTFAHADSTSTSLTVTGLLGSTEYEFRVSAVNTNSPGVSIPTRPVRAVTEPPDLPAITSTPVAVAGYNRVTLSWQPPANAAAAAPLTYFIECYRYSGSASQNSTGFIYREWVPCVPDTGQLTPNSAGSLSYIVTGLPRYSFNFRVTAKNSVGAGPVSAQSNRVTPNASRPSAPRSVTNSVATDGMSITFNWRPPANLYGTALDHYELRWYQGGSYVAIPDANGGIAAPNTTTYVWTGYEDSESSAASPLGKNFYVRVYACNDEICSSSGGRTRVRLGTPRPPTAIQTAAHDSQAYASWTPGVVSGAYGPTANYEVQYRVVGSGTSGWTEASAQRSNNPAITIAGLANGTAYEIRVRAVGFNNRTSSWLTTSTALRVTPTAGAGRALDAVGDLGGEAGVERVALTWTAPAPSDDQPAATDYLIEKSTSPIGPWAVYKDGVSAETTAVVKNLRAGTSYYFRVQAVNINGLGTPSVTGPYSPEEAAPPGPPTDLRGQASENAVELTWARPADDGGAVITAYPVEYREFGSPDWQPVEVEDEEDPEDDEGDTGDDEEEVEAPTSFLLTGLDIDTAYEFRVAALNHAGQSDWTESIRVTTGILPDMPSNLTAVGRYEAVGLSWTAPDYSGSQAIIGYQVEYRLQDADAATPWQIISTLSDATVATVRNLVNDVMYDFRVRTVTYVGVSEPALATAIPGGLPLCDSPTDLNGKAGYTSASLSWTASANAAECGLEDYIVEYRQVGDPTWTAWVEWQHEPSTETAASIEDLTHNTSYEFRVSAYNGALSEPSNVLRLTIDGTVDFPYAPEDPWAEPEYNEVVLHWSPPSWDGGSAIIDYVIQFKQASATVWNVYEDGVSAAEEAVLQLDPTIAYNCRVAAKNELGRGAYSDSVDCQSLVPPTVTSAPLTLTATALDSAVSLAWLPPSDDGGAPPTSYVVQYRASGGAWTEQAVPQATPTSAVVSGLANGTAYEFQVAAVNEAGRGPWSNTATATPDDGVVPPVAPPASVSADVAAACGQVTLTWQAPTGDVVEGYTVSHKPSAAADWQSQDVSDTTAVIAGLAAGSYDFRLRAVNHKGLGPWSETVTASVVACLTPPTAVPALTA
ncbi:MAG: fibronectin type III domain-containing protein, partial [Propionibacteriaceae bacterium]|nr:fibronectin type III domain-containing protein [Propionibacteriaceae bacterium]